MGNKHILAILIITILGIFLPPKVNTAQPNIADTLPIAIESYKDTVEALRKQTEPKLNRNLKLANEILKEVKEIEKPIIRQKSPKIEVLARYKNEIVPIPHRKYKNYYVVDVDQLLLDLPVLGTPIDTVPQMQKIQVKKEKNLWKRVKRFFKHSD